MGLTLIEGALKNLFQSVRAVRSNCNLEVLVFEEREKLRNALRKATDSVQEREPAENLTSQSNVRHLRRSRFEPSRPDLCFSD